MKLYTYHTNESQRCCVIVKTGRKWLSVVFVGAIRIKRVPTAEMRFFREIGNITMKQRRSMNRFARTCGATKQMVPLS